MPSPPSTTPAAPDGAPEAGPPGSRAAAGSRAAGGAPGLVAGAVAVMALRLWVVSEVRFPRVMADETAYLAMARLLGGGPRWNLDGAASYGAGYSVLLAPWFALDLSPDAVYRAALLTNVAAAGLTFVVVALVTRRLTTLAAPWALAAGAVATCLPGVALTSRLAWSDAVTPLCFALVVLTVLRLVERPTAARGVVAGLTVVAGMAVHTRLLPMVGVVGLVVLALAGQRRLGLGATALTGAVTGAAFLATRAATGAIHDRVYPPGGKYSGGLSDLDGLANVGRLASATTGQVWYLLVTTAGLAGLGGAGLVAGWWRAIGVSNRLRRWRGADEAGPEGQGPADHGRDGQGPGSQGPIDQDPTDQGPPTPGAPRLAAGIRPLDPVAATAVLALMALPFVTGALFISGGGRGDQVVYGRYNEMFVAVLASCGVAVLAAARRRADLARALVLAAVPTAGAGALVWLTRLATLKGGYTPYTIQGLVALEPHGPQRLRTATAAALVLIVVVVGAAALRRGRPAALLVVAALLATVGTVRGADVLGPHLSAEPRHVTELTAILEPGDEVVYLMEGSVSVVEQFYRNQFYLPDVVAVRSFGAPWERGRTFIVAGTGEPGILEAGYRLAWVDPGTPAGLWVGPGPRQRALAAAGELLPAGLAGISPAMERAAVRFTTAPSASGDALSARVTVDRPAGEPWPGLDRTAPAAGRVRVGVRVEDAACACTVVEGRADLEDWVAGDVREVAVPVEVDLAGLAPGRYQVTAQLVREGEAWFGTPGTAEVTVGS